MNTTKRLVKAWTTHTDEYIYFDPKTNKAYADEFGKEPLKCQNYKSHKRQLEYFGKEYLDNDGTKRVDQFLWCHGCDGY